MDEIWKHFAQIAALDVADNLLIELERAAHKIASEPLAWRERPDLMPGIRITPVRPYLIFYRLNNTAAEVVRVLHERRDAAHVLSTSLDTA